MAKTTRLVAFAMIPYVCFKDTLRYVAFVMISWFSVQLEIISNGFNSILIVLNPLKFNFGNVFNCNHIGILVLVFWYFVSLVFWISVNWEFLYCGFWYLGFLVFWICVACFYISGCISFCLIACMPACLLVVCLSLILRVLLVALFMILFLTHAMRNIFLTHAMSYQGKLWEHIETSLLIPRCNIWGNVSKSRVVSVSQSNQTLFPHDGQVCHKRWFGRCRLT